MNPETANNIDFSRLINYCLGYIKLINPSLSRFTLFTDPIDSQILDPSFIHTSLPDDAVTRLPLNLEAFYTLNPNDLTDENREEYEIQKSLVESLEKIAAKYKVSEYTKQINLNFGYMNVELAEEAVHSDNDEDENPKKKAKGKTWNPLFSLTIKIDTVSGVNGAKQYVLDLIDVSVLPNIGFLLPIVGDEYFAKIAHVINGLESDGQLKLPLANTTIDTIWNEIKTYLKLSDALFDEDSFEADRLVVSLSAKSNFFLTQDLIDLAVKDEEELSDTALSGWLFDEEMSIEEPIDEESSEIFFPFDYDKYQLKSLSIINNRASIIQGPPGTGKSQTIANILCHLAANGHRVLFLSQKDQALRGVKDTLKKLDIKYLYGYIPNRQSQLYSPQDERDGAANALSGIEQYLDGFQSNVDANLSLLSKHKATELFDDSIEQQRHFFELTEAVNNLKDYDLGLASAGKFQSFSADDYEQLVEMRSDHQKLEKLCSAYVTANKKVSDFNKRFGALDFSKVQYHKYFDQIMPIVESEAYDRNNRLGRALKNRMLKTKIREYTSKLPRELFEEFDSVLNSGDSRAVIVGQPASLQLLCPDCRDTGPGADVRHNCAAGG